MCLSSGPTVLRDGVRERRRLDVPDSALQEVRRGALSLLRRRGDIGPDVPAPPRSHIQVNRADAASATWLYRFSVTEKYCKPLVRNLAHSSELNTTKY